MDHMTQGQHHDYVKPAMHPPAVGPGPETCRPSTMARAPRPARASNSIAGVDSMPLTPSPTIAMSASTVIVAAKTQLLRRLRLRQEPTGSAPPVPHPA